MTAQSEATSTSAPGRAPCVRVFMCSCVRLCMTTKETGHFCDFWCFGDIRWSHLDCISGPTLESTWLYISTHSGHGVFFLGSHNLVCCVYWAKGGGSPISEKSIWWVWFPVYFRVKTTDIYTYRYIYIYIYIYVCYIYVCASNTLDVWCFSVFFFADTAQTRRHIPIGGSVAGKS